MTTTSYNGASTTFPTRNASYRNVGGVGDLIFATDGATFRFATTPRDELGVWELTSAPEFSAFERNGETLYEPVLSAEAVPVYSPNFATDANSGTTTALNRESKRRRAHLSAATRARIYDPTFLEDLLPSVPLSSNDLTLAKLSPLKIGERVVAFWNRSSGRFELVATPKTDVLRFRLTSALTTGGSATANALFYDSSSADYANAGLEIQVVDAFGRFNGSIGKRGVARRFGDRDDWEILFLEN